MKRLHEADETAILTKHKNVPLRVYIEDPIQKDRIRRARHLLSTILISTSKEPYTVHRRQKIVELGANGGDITGFFSWGHDVTQFEISHHCLSYIAKTYPWVKVRCEDFTAIKPIDCDILVLSEVLEHLADPLKVVKDWLPRAKYALISSPLEGDLKSDGSAGEHVHSFSASDFNDFVEAGLHTVVKEVTFQMGIYTIQQMLTKRKGEEL